MACASHLMLEDTRFSTMFSGCVGLCLVEGGRVAITAVLHVDDIFVVGSRNR